jgi:hypothetical protein
MFIHDMEDVFYEPEGRTVSSCGPAPSASC